jgi:UDP-N-acetylmuramoylalanine--D-glutamate ligase
MKIAIVGYGLQGESSYHYWNKDGNQITVCDVNDSIVAPSGVETQLGEAYLKNLERFDLIVRTPFLHPRDIVAANGPAILDKVTTNTNEFFRVCPSKNIIGVTGTKGKGTTTTLITRMLEKVGQTVHLGGNIGTPPLVLLNEAIQPSDWVVLELANFQLIDLKYSPKIGVCLMVVPEHLDWHKEMAEYITAKQQLFTHQQTDNIAIYYADNEYSQQVVSVSQGRHIPYLKPPGAIVKDDAIMIDNQTICSTGDLKLIGKHNWQNICAAVTVLWQIDPNLELIHSVVTSFEGLEHRLEKVTELDGVTYYNDSFAATPEAAIAAIESFTAPKVMIVGGFDRGLPLAHMAKTMLRHNDDLRKVIVMGASGLRLTDEFDKIGFKNYLINSSKDIAEIVNQARSFAKPGDVVVLSPGFASFDMFKNFEVRGQQYKAAVRNL